MVERQSTLSKSVHHPGPTGAGEPLSPATRVARRKAGASPEPKRFSSRTAAIATTTAAEPRKEPLVSAPRRLRDGAPSRDAIEHRVLPRRTRRRLLRVLPRSEGHSSSSPPASCFSPTRFTSPAGRRNRRMEALKAMLKFIRVKLNERVVLFKDGLPLRALGPGRHAVWSRRLTEQRWSTDALVFQALPEVRAVLPRDWYQESRLERASAASCTAMGCPRGSFVPERTVSGRSTLRSASRCSRSTLRCRR